MSKRRTSYLPRFAALVFLLTKAPRTCGELAKLLGVGETDHHGRIAKMLRSLEAEGLVACTLPSADEKAQGIRAKVWRWVPPEMEMSA